MHHWKWCKTMIIDIQYSQHVHCMLRIQNSIYRRTSNCKNKRNIFMFIFRKVWKNKGVIFVLSVFSAGNNEHVPPKCRIIICLCFLKFDSSKKAKEKTAWQEKRKNMALSWGKTGKTQKVRCKWKVRQLRQKNNSKNPKGNAVCNFTELKRER